jgi:phospholipase C
MEDDRQTDGTEPVRKSDMSRREIIAAITAVGAAAFVGLPEHAVAATRSAAAPPSAATEHPATALRAAKRAETASKRAVASVSEAASVAPAGGDLGAIEHIVFLMLENRSYDHYFGAYHRGRGFDDHPKHSLGVFAQDYPGGTKLSPRKKLLPFHLNPAIGESCTNDLTHNWGPQHESWNHGKMNRWVKTHTARANEGNPDGAMTMGYYTRRDIPFHWALADHFTLCDAYHSSILGPTHPNRLMANSGMIDPRGHHGGPITDTAALGDDLRWTCDWTTVQEHLEDKGVSWKVYHPSNAHTTGKFAKLKHYSTWGAELYDPSSPYVMALSDHVLPYFKAFKNPNSSLHRKAFHPTFPNNFHADIKSGDFAKVSWIIPPLGFDEHPSSPPQQGMWFTQQVVEALSANKKLWSKTALFVMYDENDGWFDHVAPPTAPKGTPGEWLTASHKLSPETNGIRGPLGLGVRVPMLVISPFSRGGHISSEVFDHTSQLKLLSERFGIEVPNVSKWRKETVGDLTSALFRGKHDMSMPALPKIPIGTASPTGTCEAEYTEMGGAAPTIPTKQGMPTQHGKIIPAKRWFPEAPTTTDRVPARSGRNTATKKSAHNALTHGQVVKPAKNR